ncbi:hypothetical protein SGFS_049500 [Streptomyces graminofaciens]|uniref:Uncharacterized protein n=1 Tax=Streptomyces graminofaciens TaxID=68212 RepID=A0ABM7FC61_9ACTN|nr:hypothetical protein SGFS_049500 [Streptomyces graminofaciens]
MGCLWRPGSLLGSLPPAKISDRHPVTVVVRALRAQGRDDEAPANYRADHATKAIAPYGCPVMSRMCTKEGVEL